MKLFEFKDHETRAWATIEFVQYNPAFPSYVGHIGMIPSYVARFGRETVVDWVDGPWFEVFEFKSFGNGPSAQRWIDERLKVPFSFHLLRRI
jgi:hypothetical protein